MLQGNQVLPPYQYSQAQHWVRKAVHEICSIWKFCANCGALSHRQMYWRQSMCRFHQIHCYRVVRDAWLQQQDLQYMYIKRKPLICQNNRLFSITIRFLWLPYHSTTLGTWKVHLSQSLSNYIDRPWSTSGSRQLFWCDVTNERKLYRNRILSRVVSPLC